ncbi:hypothetical protein [Nocardia sp. N2S4-5]|uniref:hypothetical protein n=1 Tax=Nocardia sp. N2S4-5 TaxID=3351565 RepID=UPI0037CFCF16
MREIPTAAAKLAAIDLVRGMAEHRWNNGYGIDGLDRLRRDAEQQLAEDTAIGDALSRLDGYPENLPALLGALVRQAVESVGARIEFGDGVVDAQVLAGYVLARRHPDGTMWVDGEVWPDHRPAEQALHSRHPGYAVYELREVHAEPPTGHTAPGIGTQDHAPDRERDVYDEIRAERVAAMSGYADTASSRPPNSRILTQLAASACEKALADVPARREHLVRAAALAIAAIEVFDA